MTRLVVMVTAMGSISMYLLSTGVPIALYRTRAFCPEASSKRVAMTQCSPAAAMATSERICRV